MSVILSFLTFTTDGKNLIPPNTRQRLGAAAILLNNISVKHGEFVEISRPQMCVCVGGCARACTVVCVTGHKSDGVVLMRGPHRCSFIAKRTKTEV
jgi:hypothetical protein